jgi:Protein of unknown function (DUF4229)
MRSVLIYTLSRLALFAATAGVLYLVGARGFLLLALAILISGVVSFVLLSRQGEPHPAGPRRGRRPRGHRLTRPGLRAPVGRFADARYAAGRRAWCSATTPNVRLR